MTKVDQFESVFRSAFKDSYQFQRVDFDSILVITDLEQDPCQHFLDKIIRFSSIIHVDKDVKWQTLGKGDFNDTLELRSRPTTGPQGLHIANGTRPNR